MPFAAGLPDAGWLAALEAAAWASVWALFRRPAVFHWLLLPAFLTAPADVWLSRHYGLVFSAQHLGILFDSTPREALEFLGAKTWPLVAALLASIAWWGLGLLAARKTSSLDWAGRSRRFALAVPGAAAAVVICGWFFGVTSYCGTACAEAAALNDDETEVTAPVSPYALPGWVLRPFENIDAGDTRPFGWLAIGAEFWREQHALSASRGGFSFGAHPRSGTPPSLVIVLVIGESGRYDRWGLNGYARDTSPELRKERNVTSFSDVVTPASATRLSLPVMLTRKGALNTFRTGFRETSLISAFREAGFKTYWLSNQMPFGDYDTPVSVFAKEAETVEFLNPGDYNGKSSYDGALLDPLARSLREAGGRKLIVLHTLGNHWDYSLRYPPAFSRWTPEGRGDGAGKAAVSNSYDNSVLYADWFLSRAIGALKSAGGPALLLYVADHGENLQDGKCDFDMHGHNTVYDFHVPMIAWYSDAYEKSFPAKAAQVKGHHGARLSTENIFPSLLDLADIGYTGEKPGWSFADGRFEAHKRYVDSYGWADYDHAEIRGICHEIVDKGEALPRRAGPLVSNAH